MTLDVYGMEVWRMEECDIVLFMIYFIVCLEECDMVLIMIYFIMCMEECEWYMLFVF